MRAVFPPSWDEAALRVYEVDLERFARRMRRTGRAFTLTTLSRQWIHGRLRPGRPSGDVVSTSEQISIRFWDPLEAWQPGDWAVFPVTYTRNGGQRWEPRAGQVVRVTGTALTAHVDGEATPRIWGIPTQRDGAEITRWRASLCRYIRRLGRSHTERAGIDYVLFQQGPSIMGGLLAALRSDGRFVEWEGRWFLRDLIAYPEASQLVALAHTLLAESSNSLRLSELLGALPQADADDSSTSFGFALAMSERPDLFSRVEAGRYIRWVLASPPPGEYEAQFAVYHPKTYEVICEPGDALTPCDVEELWRLDLLATAVHGKP